MPNYHIKVVKGRKETLHPCEGFTTTIVPPKGYYAENPHLINMPEGQKIKLELEFVNTKGEMDRKSLYLPKDGSVAYVMDNLGNTIHTYPRKRDREPLPKEGQEFGLKVGAE